MSYGTKGSLSPYSDGAAERCTGSVKAADYDQHAIDMRNRLATGFMIGLPRPPSVNRFVRRLGNRSPEVQEWIRSCDRCIMAMRPKPSGVRGEFEVTITWDQRQVGKFDLDNMIKPLMDYLQRIELIENDRLCRKLQVGWGSASMGCIVTVMPCR